jgi:16S rRNA (uracil1498-N3)-methyltransferase
MNAPRFFVDAELCAGTTIALPPPVAHHAQHALRLRDGAPIVLFNGRGGEYRALLHAGRDTGARIEAFDPVERESPLDVTLVQALVATDKLDWIAEKATELGVHRIVLAPCERSVVRLGAERLARRLAHAREVILAACCQCGRNRVPQILAATHWAEALAAAGAATRRLLLLPGAARTLAALAAADPTAVAVGPEGGLTEAEIDAARRAGWAEVRLGPRVLRTESAGCAAVATLQALAGDYR